jgi:hypothetical protein
MSILRIVVHEQKGLMLLHEVSDLGSRKMRENMIDSLVNVNLRDRPHTDPIWRPISACHSWERYAQWTLLIRFRLSRPAVRLRVRVSTLRYIHRCEIRFGSERTMSVSKNPQDEQVTDLIEPRPRRAHAGPMLPSPIKQFCLRACSRRHV